MKDKSSTMNNKLYFTFFFLLLLFNTFERNGWVETHIISEASLYLTIIAMYFHLLKTQLWSIKPMMNYRAFYSIMLLFLFYLSYSFIGTEFMELPEYVTLIFFLTLIVVVVRAPFHEEALKVAGTLFTVVVVAFFVHWVVSGLPLRGFSSVYSNQNYLAVLLFSMLYFQVVTSHYSKRTMRSIYRLAIALNGVLIFVSGARSVLISIIAILLTALCIRYYRVILHKLLYIVMLSSLLFVGVYSSLSFMAVGEKLNAITYELTDKNLFSGRQEIWVGVMQAIVKHPFVGHGIGVQAYDVTDVTEWPAHNMYLQLFLEFGIIGFGLFFVILVVLWKMLLSRLDTFAAKCSLCFMSGILVYNTFEMTMFQNNYSIAVFQWLIIGVGIGFMEKDKDNSYVTYGQSAMKR